MKNNTTKIRSKEGNNHPIKKRKPIMNLGRSYYDYKEIANRVEAEKDDEENKPADV